MLAMRIHDFGGSDALRLEEIDTPEPGPGEMRLRVHAAGVNPVDFKIRQGKFPPVDRSALPLILGGEVSGVVEAAGEGVTTFNPGAMVHAMVPPGRGGYASHIILRPSEAAPISQGTRHAEAAALPLAGLTAWQGLVDHGRIAEGQRVLIHGGAGGVGHIAIQIAKAKGCEVLTTARREDEDFLAGLGADRVIDYRNEDFTGIATDCDIVLDTVAGDVQARSFGVLKRGGRLVSTLDAPDQDLAEQHGVEATAFMAAPDGTDLEELDRMVAAGDLRAAIARTFDLGDAGAAQDTLESEHIQGKIVLDVP